VSFAENELRWRGAPVDRHTFYFDISRREAFAELSGTGSAAARQQQKLPAPADIRLQVFWGLRETGDVPWPAEPKLRSSVDWCPVSGKDANTYLIEIPI